MRKELLAEQSRIVARLVEITSILSSENPEVASAPTMQTNTPVEFDSKAYAIGLIWRNPTISTRELAQKVGVAKSTLFLPSWADVAKFIKARKNVSPISSKDQPDSQEDDE